MQQCTVALEILRVIFRELRKKNAPEANKDAISQYKKIEKSIESGQTKVGPLERKDDSSPDASSGETVGGTEESGLQTGVVQSPVGQGSDEPSEALRVSKGQEET